MLCEDYGDGDEPQTPAETAHWQRLQAERERGYAEAGLVRRYYVPTDLDAAYEAWGCNCGPAALAALLGVECEAVRALFPGFEKRRYVNPTHMLQALLQLPGRADGTINSRNPQRPEFGLLFVQWGGPWLKPGVPIGAAYRHTHWIAVDGEAVFDVNADTWVSRQDWEDPQSGVAAWIMSHVPRCDGTWSVRTAISVSRSRRTLARLCRTLADGLASERRAA